ncbi:subtilisin-like serine protease [Serendipita sp. 405]|nr:subtilisin-like serine protease [Serendipita sp. 397]KAG8803634.1 subtilisin-like serine protease [Serendipita sp. 398]KAG8874856.1 subtilisin-like serine protease [Serendipita sp. 405]
MFFSFSATLAAFALSAFVQAAPLQERQETQKLSVRRVNGRTVKGRYIVKLKDAVETTHHIESLPFAFSVADAASPIVQSFVDGFFSGYAGDFSKEDLDFILASPDVEYVEEDAWFYALDQQVGAPWSLQSISTQKKVGGWDVNAFTYTYSYSAPAGDGVDIYIVDTGVNTEHEEFEGRATFGYAAAGMAKADGNGHGTHCAGSAAGKTYGVAKKANIIAVKVLQDNGQGATSDIIAGLQWVVTNAKSTGRPSIGSMSLGGEKSDALDQAVSAAIKAGVPFVVAAGNSNVDAAQTSPARVADAITVGASDIANNKAEFSNFGAAVDIFAPGVDITSAWKGSPQATKMISGTSMATPHVAGLAAYFLSKDTSMSPAAITDKIKSLGTKNAIQGLPAGTVNLLAFNGGADSSEPAPSAPAPSATTTAVPSATTTAVPDLNTPSSEGKNNCPTWWPNCFWKDW